LLKLSALLATMIMAGLAFGVCGVLLRIEELNELRSAVSRRLRRRLPPA
jgi:hypothetical protein